MLLLKQVLPAYRLPVSLIKNDEEAISAFNKEWRLLKAWILSLGWSIMTFLLVALAALLDSGLISLPGRSSSLGFYAYLSMVIIGLGLGAVTFLIKTMIDRVGDLQPTHAQLSWVKHQRDGLPVSGMSKRKDLVNLLLDNE